MSVIKIKIKQKPGVGYNVSHSERKTKRLYRINTQVFKFFSNILNTNIKIQCSCNKVRDILRYCSIDRYLICKRENKILKELLKVRKLIFKKIKQNKNNIEDKK